jgi:hypothetical protein
MFRVDSILNTRRVKRDTCLKLTCLIFTIVFIFVACELIIRALGSYDKDGNFFIWGRHLKPYHLPVATVQDKLENYLLRSSLVVKKYSPSLGWTTVPNRKSKNGLYSYNSLGLRSPVEYSISPQKGVLRVAIFGDSFTLGSDVQFENSWGYYLEERLKKAGMDAEVINFGVGGYGMDQAFLRWKELGHKFSPDIVIFGLQMENVKRNVNLLRPIYDPSAGVPFSKPRFILIKNDLKLINVPTISPENIPDTITNIDTWSLVNHEYFFKKKDYMNSIWLRSKLASLIINIISQKRTENHFYELSEEPAQVTLKILQEFREDVESNRGKFLIVHLPTYPDMRDLLDDEKLKYSELLERIKTSYDLIQPNHALIQEAKNSSLDSLFVGHYSPRANQVIANAIGSHIVEIQKNAKP